ncbi:MAG: nucleotidyltransferase family protein [Bacillota bacterium]|nr:nucleotidyltransferase family protein [Bacillota bacterium]
MKTKNKIGALIVAAGKSSRMQAFKPMLPLAEDTLIRTLIRQLLAVGASPIVLVVGKNATELSAHVSDLPVECVCNPDYASTDMFCSVRIGMEQIRGRCEIVLFSPGDCPCFSPESAKTLIEEMEKSQVASLTPCYQGRRGHPVLFRQEIIGHILSYKGEGGLRGALDTAPGEQRLLPLEDPGLILDADRPEDYEGMLAYEKQQKKDTHDSKE